uniref:Troponin I4a n=1 Tax=Astyanax mexicanus TaxID=7994 RepID=A0A3B1JNM7_ASTMX
MLIMPCCKCDTSVSSCLSQTKLLRKAESLLDKEQDQKRIERENVLNERAPPLKLSGLSVQELQELCKDLHHKIDIVDEARYDLLLKVGRNDSEIQSLHQKIYELKGKMKRPKLKRVKKSADDMLGALTDNKLMKADFKANLKTVKKEEEKVTLMPAKHRFISLLLKFQRPSIVSYQTFSQAVQSCCCCRIEFFFWECMNLKVINK